MKSKVKKLRLSPYPGIVFVTKDKNEFKKIAKKLIGVEQDLNGRAGRFLAGPSKLHPHTALVWWTTPATLAHEMAHVVFDVFEHVGIDNPQCGNNEPFCYLLSQLITDTLAK